VLLCRLQLRDAWKIFRRSAVRLCFILLSTSSCMLSSVILCSLDLGRRNVSPVVCDADEFQRKIIRNRRNFSPTASRRCYQYATTWLPALLSRTADILSRVQSWLESGKKDVISHGRTCTDALPG
jgi:hypothetical protein